MEAMWILLLVAIVASPFVLSIWAIVRTARFDREISTLKTRIISLSRQVEMLSAGREPMQGEEAVAPKPTVMPDAAHDEAVADDTEQPDATEPEERDAELEPDAEWQPGDEIPEEVWRAQPEPTAPPPAAREGLEQRLTSRWLVWLGGVTLALAGVFLVKYAAEQGLLGPRARIFFGLLFSAALVAGGEWIRRNPKHGLAELAPTSYVPQALTAAGVFTAFASIFAAYGLYDLLAPLVAFGGLAAVALLAFALSLLQGPFVALLGLIGGFATPILISTGSSSAWGLFSYLLMIFLACLAIVRYQRWWWLAFAAIGGAAAWALLWLAVEHRPGDVFATGIYLLAIVSSSLFFWRGYEIPDRPANWLKEIQGLTMPEVTAWVGALSAAVLMPGLVQFSDQSFASLVFVGLLCLLYGFFGRRNAGFDALAAVAGVVVLFVISAWYLPGGVDQFNAQPLPGGWRFLGPVLEPALTPFAVTTVLFGALFAVGGFAGLWGAKRPAIWAGVSVAVPVALLVLSYFRIGVRVPDVNWSIIALLLAAISVAAAQRLIPHRQHSWAATALALYAAGAVAALSFAATMIFDRAVLTVALSLQLPALAWIANKLDVRLLRWIAGVVAAVVLVRLALNWNVLDYPLHSAVGSNWILYGYGVPAAMFYWAARQFREKADDHVVTLLEGGTLVFVTMLVSLEIRTFVEGSLGTGRYGLLEQSLQSISWLVIALSRIWSHIRQPRLVSLWGARILLALGTAQVVLSQLLVSNPVFTGDGVGSFPVLNTLFLAYAVPAGLLLAAAPWLGGIGFGWAKRPAQGLALVLAFIYVSFEVQRSFQGPVLSGDAQSDAEFYAYSAAWLGFALVLLLIGIYRQLPMLRHAALGVLLLTVVKVFLLDMGDLTGLLRVASFLGLGLFLVGIGYVYQRFVFPAEAPGDDGAGAGDAASDKP